MAVAAGTNSGKLVTFTIFSEGTKIDDTISVQSININKSINKIPTATIQLIAGDMPDKDFPASNLDTFKPGKKIKITVGYESEEDTIFEGIVLRHGIKIQNPGNAILTVVCKDAAIQMTVGRKNANFTESKDSDAISKIIGTYSSLSSDVSATTFQHKELVQYYSSDWDFMVSRAEINGLIVIIDNAKVSVVKPDVSSAAVLKVTYGEDIQEFDVEIDAQHQYAAIQSTSWDMTTQKIVQQEGSMPTLNKQGNLSNSDLSDVIGLDSYNLQTTAPIPEQCLKSWADGQLLKSGLSRIKGTVSFQGNALVKPGTAIEIDGVGERFTGNAFVGGVNHDIANGDWITEVELGISSEWFSERNDITAPSAAGLLPGMEGLHIGIVKKLDADPYGECLIQVSVPILTEDTEGVWARLTQFHASNGFGAFFIPEIGDEVILGFLNNDPSHPVVLGSVYSSKNKPPYDLSADNYTKAIVTQSKLTVEFDDENKVITLMTPGGNKILISDKDKSILISDQNSNKIELSGSGIVLDSAKDIKISSKANVSIEGTTGVNIKSSADVKIEGLNISQAANVGFTATGNATAEVSASGQTTIKGAIVMIN